MANPITPVQFRDALMSMELDMREAVTAMITVISTMDALTKLQRLEFLEYLSNRYIYKSAKDLLERTTEHETGG